MKRPLVDPEKKRQPRSNVFGQWRFTPTNINTWLLTYDTNFWKSKIDRFLRVTTGSKSALTLFGGKSRGRKPDHRMIAEQLVSEKPTWLEAQNRRVEIWTLIGGRDNHFLDCLVGCAALAHTAGCKLPSAKTSIRPDTPEGGRKRKKRRFTF